MVGLFMGIYSIAAVAGRPIVGWILQKYGVVTALMIGSLAISLPALGYIGLIDHGLHPLMWMLRLVQGFGYGAHFSAAFTLAAELAPTTRRNEAIAMYGASGLTASMIGPYVGESLMRSTGLSMFFLAMCIVGVIAAIIIARVRLPNVHSSLKAKTPPFRDMFESKQLRILLAISFLLAICYSSPTSFIATVAKARSVQHFSLYFTAWGITGILTRLIGGTWADRLGARQVLIPGFLFYASGLLTIHFSDALPGFIIAGVLCGCAHGISFPAVTSLAYTLAPQRLAGSTMAYVTGVMDAGSAITALLIGSLAQSIGFGIVFPFAASAAMIAFLLVLFAIQKKVQPL